MRTLFTITSLVLVFAAGTNASAEEQIPLKPENCFLIEGEWFGNTYVQGYSARSRAEFRCMGNRVKFSFRDTYTHFIDRGSVTAPINNGIIDLNNGYMKLFRDGEDLILREKITITDPNSPRFEGVSLRKRLVREGVAANLLSPLEIFRKKKMEGSKRVRLHSDAAQTLAGKTFHGAWRVNSKNKKGRATLYFERLGGGIVMGRLILYGRPVPRHAGIAGITDEGELDVGGGFSFGGRRLADGTTAFVIEGLEVPDGMMDVFFTNAKLTQVAQE